MDFVTSLFILIDWKGDSYNFILIIIDRLTNMVYYKPVKITIDIPSLVEIIIDVVIWHHGLPNSIMTSKSSVINSRFWSLLCYFFGIERCLSTNFHAQTDRQTNKQNNIMKAYLKAFVNFESNNWARLLPIAEFAYNNAKKANTGQTLFELNCEYHPWVFYEENINSRSKSKLADKLSLEQQELMTVCRENIHYAQEL